MVQNQDTHPWTHTNIAIPFQLPTAVVSDTGTQFLATAHMQGNPVDCLAPEALSWGDCLCEAPSVINSIKFLLQLTHAQCHKVALQHLFPGGG